MHGRLKFPTHLVVPSPSGIHVTLIAALGLEKFGREAIKVLIVFETPILGLDGVHVSCKKGGRIEWLN